MAVYRFRITFEEHEDVYREIDIQGKQTFEDFHRAIQEAISFDNSKDASFFMSDDFWKKGQEITLNLRSHDDDDDEDMRRKGPAPRLMSKSRVVEFIDDPHQKILYIFDPQAQWTFFIELVRIVNEEPKTLYPKCTKTVGQAPKQYKVTIAPPTDDEEEIEEEESPKKEKVFHAEEGYEEGEQSDGESGEGEESEGESEGETESEEESGGDFDEGSFEKNSEEDY